MIPDRLHALMQRLTDKTVLAELLAPVERALSRVRQGLSVGRVLDMPTSSRWAYCAISRGCRRCASRSRRCSISIRAKPPTPRWRARPGPMPLRHRRVWWCSRRRFRGWSATPRGSAGSPDGIPGWASARCGPSMDLPEGKRPLSPPDPQRGRQGQPQGPRPAELLQPAPRGRRGCPRRDPKPPRDAPAARL